MTETPAEGAAREELTSRTRVTLRPIAGPLALGFFGLAAATFVMSGLQLGWVDSTEGKQVALCILAFTVPLQFTASLLGFLARDGVAATGMGVLAGIWAVIGLITFSAKPGSTSDALGLFLLVAGVAMWAPASAAFASKLVPALVLSVAGLRFLVTGLYQLTSNEAWEDTAGVIGLVLAVFAIYAAYAAELEDVLKRPVLPLGRRGRGESAVRGTYAEQIANVAHEPGVRQQL
jgi:succinate-acetate transporter protein